MKTTTTFYELLLFTGTSFSNRAFSTKNNSANEENFLPQKEELEKACWDGMLCEMFPELTGLFSKKCESFIWQILQGKNYLSIHIGLCPPVLNSETTIDPYWMLTSLREN
jgi:hypothetical protein